MPILGYIFVFIFVMSGIAIKHFHFYWLISGYHLLSNENKKRVNRSALCNYAGNQVFIMAILMFGGVLAFSFGMTAGIGIAVLLIAILGIVMTVKVKSFVN